MKLNKFIKVFFIFSSVVLIIVYAWLSTPLEQHMRIRNYSSEPITIKEIKIGGTVVLHDDGVPFLLNAFTLGMPRTPETDYLLSFTLDKLGKLELTLSTLITSNKDFSVTCNLPHEEAATCLFLVSYKKDSTLSCFCDSMDVPVNW